MSASASFGQQERPATAALPTISHAKLSCLLCRDRKLKCDRILSGCLRCVESGQECMYPRARATHRGKRTQVHELEAKIVHLEKQVQSLGSPIAATSEAYRSNVSPGDLPRHGHEQPLRLRAQVYGALDGQGPRLPEEAYKSHSTRPQEDLADNDDLSIEPLSPALREELSTLYFEKVYHCSPMLHRIRYMESLKSSDVHCQPHRFLQYVILATGATAFASHRPFAVPLYQKSRRLAETDEMKNDHVLSISHAQYWLLIANFEAEEGWFPRAAISLARSIRIAHLLNLHRMDSVEPVPAMFFSVEKPRDWIEVEEQRRTWWNIYAADRLVHATTGIPATIDDEKIHTFLPVSEEAFDHGREEQSIMLRQGLEDGPLRNTRLATRILATHIFYRAIDLETLSMGPGKHSDASKIDQYRMYREEVEDCLTMLLARLPSCLRLSQNSSCQHAIFVNVLIHAATMCLHKAAIRRISHSSGSSGGGGESDGHRSSHTVELARLQSRGRMLVAATQIAAIFRTVVREGVAVAALRNPIQDYVVYLAALVFLEDAANTGSEDSRGNYEFLGELLNQSGQIHANTRMLHAHLRAQAECLTFLP